MTDNMRGRHLAIIALSFLTILVGGGTVLFHSLESWTWIQSFYFTVATITTVGYGDIAPTSDETRLATSLYILFGVVIGVGIIRFLIGTLVKKSQASAKNRFIHHRETKNSEH